MFTSSIVSISIKICSSAGVNWMLKHTRGENNAVRIKRSSYTSNDSVDDGDDDGDDGDDDDDDGDDDGDDDDGDDDGDDGDDDGKSV